MTSWVRQGTLQLLLFRQNPGEVKPKKTIAGLFPRGLRDVSRGTRVRGGEALRCAPAEAA